MDHIAAAEEQIVSERLRRKLEEVNVAAQSQLSPIQDHINFTLQQAYFKCAYECFDRRRNQEEISNCVEHCSVPVVKSQQHFENEMAQFQERLNRSLVVCQDKFEAAKLQKIRPEAVNEMERCVHKAIEENLNTLPHIVQRMKTAFNIAN
ncbi:protein FAM136A [Brassica rapa]|uniref:Protein FAM136A n=1 Tax=Brassica campestris TaxID=3711 RepID=M4CN57_BRACM|nr:protein FAM136A [Brassica rapa]